MGMAVIWGQFCNFVHGLKAAMLMVLVQVSFACMNVLYKLASHNGMSLKVIIAYRYSFAAAFMVPLALIVERNKRPKLTWRVLFLAFLCGLFGGSLVQNLYITSIYLTSATFTSAMYNLIPAVTFVLAVLFRLERLGLKTWAGKAKVIGTLMGVSGALLLTLYKGLEVHIWSTNVDLLNLVKPDGGHVASPNEGSNNYTLGAILAVLSCFSYSSWLIVQAKMNEIYPCIYSSTALMFVMGAIQSVVYALCTERDWSQWNLGWNIRLLTVTYAGVVNSGLVVMMITWCVQMRGPLFVSVFTPLMLVIVAALGSLLLEENLYLGSIIGAVMIVGGLYVVLWGKSKEMPKKGQLVPSTISSPESHTIEITVTSLTDTNHNKNDTKLPK